MIRLLIIGILAFLCMYGLALYLTKDQRAYLSKPAHDELMAKECRYQLLMFDYYNESAFDYFVNVEKLDLVKLKLRCVEIIHNQDESCWKR